MPMTVQWPSAKVICKNNNFLSLNDFSYTNLIQPTIMMDNCSLLMSIIAKTSNPISQTQLPQTNNYQYTNKKQSVANAIGRRGHFGFQCTICGFISMNTPVAIHMTTAHSFKNPAEWKEAVVLIPVHR